LDFYKQLRAEVIIVISPPPNSTIKIIKLSDRQGEPSPLLRSAEAWLRAELVDKQAKNESEAASGPAAISEKDPMQASFVLGGGFSSGRMAAYDFIG
jgi:hypothetical protein